MIVKPFFWNDYLCEVQSTNNIKRIEHQAFCSAPIFIAPGATFCYLEYVGRGGFYANRAIDYVRINETTKVVAEDAFGECTHLTEIVFDEGVRILGVDAFVNAAVKKLDLPDSLLIIEDGCFKDCESLEEVSFGSGLLKIGPHGFEGCKRLEKVEFPDSLLAIGEGAFMGCNSLKQVTLPKSLSNVSLEGVFEKDVEISFGD